ncbi:MAG: dihydrolipoyl dehydrogenase [Burkholderiales bacterium]|nr:dihydrolipoyl dehydrogenase [Burkholderiales bacterium]
MSETTEIRVPDIGDFKDVEVIEVAVKAGDAVNAEDTLISLESDKATMDVPSPVAGVVAEVKVKVGDRVSEGTVIASLQAKPAGDDRGSRGTADAASAGDASGAVDTTPPAAAAARKAPVAASNGGVSADVVVLGAGPGGYTAAFRAADLGLDTVLVERYPTLGGVCLNVGCIPSKALLHAAEVLSAAEEMAAHGIEFGPPRIDTKKLAGWKSDVVGRLTKGLAGLARQRKIRVVQGTGKFTDANTIEVTGDGGTQRISFAKAIIAAGSQPVRMPGFPNDDPRLMDSTDALELEEIPKRLLVIGGGIIGLEMATVYDALGARVTVVELTEGLMPGCDRDLVKPLEKRIRAKYENIYTGTKVTGIEASVDWLRVGFEGGKAPASDVFDRVLVAVGRRPNGKHIGAEAAGVEVDERGFIPVDSQQRTNVSHIFAIGDVVGQPMLAHKATHEGKVAAEVCAGHKSAFDALTVPSVAYTDPEVAWMGVTEEQARRDGIEYEKGAFPWAASGRALGMGRDEGLTKLLFDKKTGRVIGAGIVGLHAGDLITEAVLALEMGADMRDIGLTVHPHPTLSETVCFAAEMAEGTITDLYVPKKK